MQVIAYPTQEVITKKLCCIIPVVADIFGGFKIIKASINIDICIGSATKSSISAKLWIKNYSTIFLQKFFSVNYFYKNISYLNKVVSCITHE